MRIEGAKEVREYLKVLRTEEIPKAFEITINKTMGQVKKLLQSEVKSSLDRPKKWSVDTQFINPVSVKSGKYTASIEVKKRTKSGTSAVKVLGHNIEGGTRPHKAHENWMIGKGVMKANQFIVPGPDAKRDKFGNQTAVDIKNAIAGLGSGVSKGGWVYLLSTDGNTVFKAKGSQVQIIWYIVDNVKYTKRYDFFGVGIKDSGPLLIENALFSIQKAIERR